MATVILYPASDLSVNHSKSVNNSSGFALINDVISDDNTGYIYHSLTTSNSTQQSSFKCLPNDTIGKIKINSAIINVRYLFNVQRTESRTVTINPSISINNVTSTTTSQRFTTGTNNYTNITFNVNQLNGIDSIFNSFDEANINLILSTSGSYSSDGSKNTNSAQLRITQANITIDYDLVFDCKAEIIAGHGIASATPTSQEVVEGDSCTFSATVESNWRFVGWYEASDFSGTPVSTNNPYTRTINSNITLYPKAEPSYEIKVYGKTDRFNYTLSKTRAFVGDSVTLTVTSKNAELYSFSSIYEANSDGTSTSTFLSNNNPYTFTMPSNDVNLYVEVGKKIRIYVTCSNCSLVGATSPIVSSGGKQETISFIYDSSTSDWSGIYSDPQFTNRLTNDTTLVYKLAENDLYLYARAIPKQGIYIKENGVWISYSEVWVKENGSWVKKDDFSNIFDIIKNYKRIDL